MNVIDNKGEIIVYPNTEFEKEVLKRFRDKKVKVEVHVDVDPMCIIFSIDEDGD